MEFFWIALFFAVLIFGFDGVFKAIKSTTKATTKTLSEGSNIFANLREEYREMGRFEIQIIPTRVTLGKRELDAFEVEVRGLIDAKDKSDLSFVTSVFDFSDEKLSVVTCSVDIFQEATSQGFQSLINAGQIGLNQGYKNWVRVATIYPETLIGTYSGKRKIKVLVRALPSDQVSLIERGFSEKGIIIFSQASAVVEMELIEKGWMEAQKERALARVLVVKIAVSVACSDGGMNAAEGRVIQSWIKGQLGGINDDHIERVKEELNSALKESFSDSQKDMLDQDLLVLKLKDINLAQMNQGLLELLVAVIGADEEITKDEMSIVNKIGKELGVDYSDIKAMADKAFLDNGNLPDTSDDLEGLLGIDPTWEGPKILSHLRGEFSKWNGRIQALEDDSEKEKAQKMLDAIASARKKYGAQ